MAFVGRQVRLTVPDDATDAVEEFYVDLPFFHATQLRYFAATLIRIRTDSGSRQP